MAANCPAASQCLLRGCIDAHKLAKNYKSMASNDAAAPAEDAEADQQASDPSHAAAIVRVSKASARRIASLSRREALAVVRVIAGEGGSEMDGLALSLSMEHDPIDAAAFIVERLSWHGDDEEVAVTVAGPIAISDVDTATLGRRAC